MRNAYVFSSLSFDDRLILVLKKGRHSFLKNLANLGMLLALLLNFQQIRSWLGVVYRSQT